MPEPRGDALLLQEVQDALVGGKLGPGGLLVVIGTVEVGVDALDLEPIENSLRVSFSLQKAQLKWVYIPVTFRWGREKTWAMAAVSPGRKP